MIQFLGTSTVTIFINGAVQLQGGDVISVVSDFGQISFGRLALLGFRTSVLVSLSILSGCSSFWTNGPSLNMPENEMSTTGVGASAGAILGAGLGTLVGSTTGNAGEGLVIGTVAGAATGGAIGHSLQQQEQNIATQKESIERQEETIDRQKNEIDGLRKQLDDRFSRKNKPSIAGDSYSYGTYAGNRQARPFSGTSTPAEDSSVSSRTVNRPAMKTSSSGSVEGRSLGVPSQPTLNSEVAARKVGENEIGTSAQTRARLEDPKPEPVSAQQKNLSGVNTDLVGSASSGATSTTAKKEPATAPGFEKSPQNDSLIVAKQPNTTPAVVGKIEKDLKSKTDNKEVAKAVDPKDESACQKAGDEAQKAQTADSAADRLFYFRRALRYCPTEAKYHVEIGKVYSSIGRVEDARYEFGQALEIDPSREDVKKEISNLQGL